MPYMLYEVGMLIIGDEFKWFRVHEAAEKLPSLLNTLQASLEKRDDISRSYLELMCDAITSCRGLTRVGIRDSDYTDDEIADYAQAAMKVVVQCHKRGFSDNVFTPMDVFTQLLAVPRTFPVKSRQPHPTMRELINVEKTYPSPLKRLMWYIAAR